MRLRAALAVLALAAPGCGSPSDPTDLTPVVEPILIDSVTVRIAESLPVQVFAHVTGIVGDGCSTLLPLEQSREGNLIAIAILRQRPKNAICTQIAKLFDQDIRLQGSFPAGRYTLRVNETLQPFEVN
jgi:hypothetical protein